MDRRSKTRPWAESHANTQAKRAGGNPLVEMLRGIRFWTLLFGVAILAGVAVLANNAGLLGVNSAGIQQGEINLAGTWKIWFEDKPEFANTTTNDKNWCLISVPDPSVPIPASSVNIPSALCPRDPYPKNRMMESTYWYRKTFVIGPGSEWKEPSLFLGAIKDKAWVYWDGELLGTALYETQPTYFSLDKRQVQAGVHTIAMRVESGGRSFPGIAHAYPRKVTVGEMKATKQEASWGGYFAKWNVAFFSFKIAVFVLLLLFALRSESMTASLFWIIVIFGANTIEAGAMINAGEVRGLVRYLALVAGVAGAAGHAWSIGCAERNRLLKRMAAVCLFWIMGSIGVNLAWNLQSKLPVDPSLVVAAILALGVISMPAAWWTTQHKLNGRISQRSLGATKIDFGISVLLFGFLATQGLSFLDSTLRVGPYRNLAALFTLIAAGLGIENHVQQQREQAFFGRFIRKGLKELLQLYRRKALGGEKLFRGRKVAILKIDIIGHTQTTFGMPYGMKRLYQDCWFSTIDQIVAANTFMDKGLGDGSLYYFEDKPNQNVCSLVLEAARKIRDEGLAAFDERFHAELHAFLERTPELQLPVQKFVEGYHARTGNDFWTRKTQSRFVLALGMVDEGLWGMVAQGHYDLEGDLITIAARLEKTVSGQQIVLNNAFAERLSQEQQIKLEWREAQLKGIGTQQYAVLAEEQLASLQSTG